MRFGRRSPALGVFIFIFISCFGVAQSPAARGMWSSSRPYEAAATFAHMATDGSLGGRVGLNGFTASVGAGVMPSVQATGEVGGYYSPGISLMSFLAGPQVGFHIYRFQPFVRGLFGISHTSINSQGRGSAFTLAAGGGLNYPLTDQLAIRAIQVEYFRPYGGGYSSADFLRIGFGISYQFGTR
jgi:opacity protein-like surface antigen